MIRSICSIRLNGSCCPGRALVVAVTVALAASSCASANREVQVPGAAPVAVPADGRERIFTRSTPAPAAPPESDAALAPLSPAVPPSTAPHRPATTTPFVAPTPPSAGVADGVAPAVTGWAAFDLHLMTIVRAGSPAVSATVLRDGEIIHEVALGDRTTAGDPVAVGDRYRIASISKVITAITTLRLVEQGRIGLDDRVGERLAARVGVASPTDGVDEMTVRHLLTHRSGLAQYENLMFRRQVESCDEAGAVGLSRDLEREPGTTLRYSNLNFCLLGLLIEDVTQRPYEEVVRSELLEPLGIDGMRLAGTFDVAERDVEHRSDEGRNYMEVLGAAGSWIGSPTDVAMIINGLDLSTPGWKPLGADAVADLRSITIDPPPPPLTEEEAATTSSTLEPPPPPAPPTRGYGMGLMIFGLDSFGHTGTLESTHAMTVRRSDGITWAITVSGDHPSSTRDLAGEIDEALRYAGVVDRSN